MADITISITVPSAYVPRLQAAIDSLDPKGSYTYVQQFKNIIRRWTIQYIQQSELQGRDISVPADIIT